MKTLLLLGGSRYLLPVIREARALGVHEILAPNLDVAREPRWGRVEETFGEDTYLSSRMAAAIIHNGAIICKEKLRFQNEIVRHKILDLIGDLYLTGMRIRGSVIAIRPGHPTNVKTAGEILKTMQK